MTAENNETDRPAPGGAPGLDGESARILALLWQEPPRPRRGPKPALSVGKIVEAAIRVADADGLAAVSMARVAEEVGYSPMALYRYVDSKDDLLVLMTERVGGPPPELPEGAGWRQGIESWTRAQVRVALEHPWFLDLPLATAPVGPDRLRWLDLGYRALAGTGLTFGDKIGILGLLAQFVLAEAQLQLDIQRASLAAARRQSGIGDETPDDEIDPALVARLNPYADFEYLLSTLATPDDYPGLHAAIAEDLASGRPAPAPEGDGATDDFEDYGFAIDILLDGIEALIARRAAGR